VWYRGGSQGRTSTHTCIGIFITPPPGQNHQHKTLQRETNTVSCLKMPVSRVSSGLLPKSWRSSIGPLGSVTPRCVTNGSSSVGSKYLSNFPSAKSDMYRVKGWSASSISGIRSQRVEEGKDVPQVGDTQSTFYRCCSLCPSDGRARSP